LLRLLGDPVKILHPFGGMAEFGLRCDLRDTHPLAARFGDATRWRPPDVIADAHHLPFANDSFDCIICDPPYSKDEAADLYQTPPIRYRDYIAEAVRVVRPGGFIASYHVVMTPRPVGTTYFCRVLLGLGMWHKLRACCVFRKDVVTTTSGENGKM